MSLTYGNLIIMKVNVVLFRSHLFVVWDESASRVLGQTGLAIWVYFRVRLGGVLLAVDNG